MFVPKKRVIFVTVKRRGREMTRESPDGRTRIEGTDTDFTVISNNPAARITGTLHFYIEEEDD